MANEIKFFLSGGTSNTNPFLSNGGTISNTEITNGLLNNLWPDVSETDSLEGVTDHKIIFIKNVSGGALTGVRAYFGELDQFTGMALLDSTTTNAAVATLASSKDAVLQSFLIWQNIAETHSTTTNLNNTNKRVVLYISDTRHPVYNQYPDQVDILMAKTGSPTGTATVKVWAMASGVVPSATDNTVIRTVGTLDVSTLTTSFVKKTFSTIVDQTPGPPPPVGNQTDRLNLSFTGAGYTSEYHLYAAGLDWTKSVGLIIYTDGSGEFGLKHPTDSYLLAGNNGMVAVAKRHNMVLLTPFSPNKACADGDGSCWYMGDPPGYAAWVEALVKKIETDYPIDKKRVAVGGYSSGAQFSTEWWVPSGAAQRTMDAGVIVAISYGGQPQMTETTYTAAFKANVKMNWNVGDKDDAYQNDGNFDAKSGFDAYTAKGFQTSLTLIPNGTHVRDGQFGAVMEAQLTSTMSAAAATALDIPSVGWRIGIEYTGGTATNHVDIAQTTPAITNAAEIAAAATTQAWTSVVVIKTDSDQGYGTPQYSGYLIANEVIEALADIAAGKGYVEGSGFVIQNGYIDTGATNSAGEICDVCEVHNNTVSANFSDGLMVPYYWDTVTKKCVNPGAATAATIPNPQPNIINHGAVSPPAPKIVLILWGTTWNTTNNTYRTTLIDNIQNKLLNTHKAWWNTAIADYKFGMPTWGQAVVYNQDLPVNPANYGTAELATALDNAINNGAVTSPATSIYTSQATNVSNYVYCIIPDPTWRINPSDGAGFSAFHSSRLYTAASTDPSPPPTQPISYRGGFTQTWDGSKWVDVTANSPCFNIYTDHGPCFQSGNPPPPGGGNPPPGECGAAQPAQGILPVAGGGGGSVNHGYAITTATDNGNDGNVATNAIDHNLATRWSQNSTNAILTLDMGASHLIDRIKVAWYKGDERQAKFHILTSPDNTTYTDRPPIPTAANFLSSGTSTALQEFGLVAVSPTNAITARYVRYTGIGNTVNNWNSVTEMEVYGPDSGGPTPTPPPPGGTNFSKPSSFDTGLILPNLNNNDFIAIHLERVIPPRSNHSELENYSIIISNEPHPIPPGDEPIPGLPGGGGPGPGVPPGGPGGPGDDPNLPPIGEIPVPSPPGVFDPGTIPPPEPIPDPLPGDPGGGPGGGPCPGPPDQPPPPPDPGGGNPPPPGGGGSGTTPDGITLVELPAGYVYQEQHTNFHENFQSNGSFRLDCGVQPQLNELNLTFYLNLSSGSDEISSKLSGGTHTDSKPKNGRCYDIGINQAGDRVRIRKEDPHPKYHDGPPSHSIHLGSLNGKWVGVQSLKWNEGNNVHLQCWVDISGATSPTNKWQRILDDVDTGGWFESPYLTCYASNDSQTTIRVDGMSTSKFHYKFLCATRIHKT